MFRTQQQRRKKQIVKLSAGLRFVLLVLFSVTFAVPAWAQESSEIIEQAKKKIESEDYDGAFAILTSAIRETPGNPQLFLKGES